jgi:hypothetical protein
MLIDALRYHLAHSGFDLFNRDDGAVGIGDQPNVLRLHRSIGWGDRPVIHFLRAGCGGAQRRHPAFRAVDADENAPSQHRPLHFVAAVNGPARIVADLCIKKMSFERMST